MPWWWKHAAGAIALFLVLESLYLWAKREYLVMEVLGSLSLVALLVAGLWALAKSADAKMIRRRQRPPNE